MTALSTSERHPSRNPLDTMEEIVASNDWAHERMSDEEMVAGVGGQWCDYRIHCAWSDDLSALHFSCSLDIRVPARRLTAVNELLAMVNGKLWVGHFDLANEDRLPTFRHTVLLRGARGATVEQLEDLLDVAIHESERYYPAFQYVIWGGRPPAEAIQAAVLEPVGEA
ncbi:MAG: YbjN domain-containing protein [Alphaproteobacteria bacterium]